MPKIRKICSDRYLGSMYTLSYCNQFDKDLKLAAKRGYKIDLLLAVVKTLHETGKLEARFRTHKLQGVYNQYLECHIKADWLLIWKQDDLLKEILFVRTGTHDDLF